MDLRYQSQVESCLMHLLQSFTIPGNHLHTNNKLPWIMKSNINFVQHSSKAPMLMTNMSYDVFPCNEVPLKTIFHVLLTQKMCPQMALSCCRTKRNDVLVLFTLTVVVFVVRSLTRSNNVFSCSSPSWSQTINQIISPPPKNVKIATTFSYTKDNHYKMTHVTSHKLDC